MMHARRYLNNIIIYIYLINNNLRIYDSSSTAAMVTRDAPPHHGVVGTRCSPTSVAHGLSWVRLLSVSADRMIDVAIVGRAVEVAGRIPGGGVQRTRSSRVHCIL